MANELDAFTIQSLLAPQTQALQTIAMRPQKSFVTTTTKPTPSTIDTFSFLKKLDKVFKFLFNIFLISF